jgi:serine/threonine protein kinase
MPGVRSAVGGYELLRELGRGGMATVYLARQIDLDRLVALKELDALRMSDPGFAKRFLREARLAGSLSHPNIVTVYDYFGYDGTPYIAMEYLERGSLRPYVGRMTLAQVGGVLEAVLAGLAHAEQRDVVHRDLKPENLLVTGDGRVKIADFGIAKATNKLQTGPALTSMGVAVGTPNYMAPEQAMAQGVGPWTDLYSVGIMAFEFFVGLTPFGDTMEPVGVLLRQVNETIPPVKELDPGIDPGLSEWIERMVAKEPAGRPQSAGAAWDELEERFLALLGPRWRREAWLPTLTGFTAAPPGPATPPPPGAPTGPLTHAHLGARIDTYPPAFSPSATGPLRDPWAAATVPPRFSPEATAPTPVKRRRGRAAAAIVVAAFALVAVAAAVVGRVGGGPPPGSAGQPDATAAKPTTTVETGARPATSQPPGSGATQPSPAPSASDPILDALPQIQANEGVSGGETLAAQAKNARALANQYEAAASQIARLSTARVRGSPTARLVVALRRTAKAYRGAATAAAGGDVTAYAAAVAAAAAAKKAANAALAEMGANGSQQPSDPAQPAPSTAPTEPQEPSSCEGDSESDDPSDDSCEP